MYCLGPLYLKIILLSIKSFSSYFSSLSSLNMFLYFLLQKLLLSKSDYNIFFPCKSLGFVSQMLREFFFFFFSLRFSDKSGCWGRNRARISQKATDIFLNTT